MNKKNLHTNCWETLPKYSVKVNRMAKWCKDNDVWQIVERRYLLRKNENTDPTKKI